MTQALPFQLSAQPSPTQQAPKATPGFDATTGPADDFTGTLEAILPGEPPRQGPERPAAASGETSATTAGSPAPAAPAEDSTPSDAVAAWIGLFTALGSAAPALPTDAHQRPLSLFQLGEAPSSASGGNPDFPGLGDAPTSLRSAPSPLTLPSTPSVPLASGGNPRFDPSAVAAPTLRPAGSQASTATTPTTVATLPGTLALGADDTSTAASGGNPDFVPAPPAIVSTRPHPGQSVGTTSIPAATPLPTATTRYTPAPAGTRPVASAPTGESPRSTAPATPSPAPAQGPVPVASPLATAAVQAAPARPDTAQTASSSRPLGTEPGIAASGGNPAFTPATSTATADRPFRLDSTTTVASGGNPRFNPEPSTPGAVQRPATPPPSTGAPAPTLHLPRPIPQTLPAADGTSPPSPQPPAPENRPIPTDVFSAAPSAPGTFSPRLTTGEPPPPTPTPPVAVPTARTQVTDRESFAGSDLRWTLAADALRGPGGTSGAKDPGVTAQILPPAAPPPEPSPAGTAEVSPAEGAPLTNSRQLHLRSPIAATAARAGSHADAPAQVAAPALQAEPLAVPLQAPATPATTATAATEPATREVATASTVAGSTAEAPRTTGTEVITETEVAAPANEVATLVVEELREALAGSVPRRLTIQLTAPNQGAVALTLVRSGDEIRAQLGADSAATLQWLNRTLESVRNGDLGFAVRWLPAQIESPRSSSTDRPRRNESAADAFSTSRGSTASASTSPRVEAPAAAQR